MAKIQNILVPVDFSPSSKLAVEYALLFAERYSAQVRLLHAWEVPAFLRPDLTVWAGELNATLSDHIRHEAEKAMKEFIADTKIADRKDVSFEIQVGQPYAVILAALETGAFDLVVMGTHGRTGLSHLVLGSVAEKVVRRSTKPVLTVRASRVGASVSSAS
jgi:nucleotide-binding universal stress UspA family protein